MTSRAGKAGKIETADRKVAKAVKPIKKHAAVRAGGWISEIADQPQLITLCSATMAVGLAVRNPGLARAGARMLAAELLATAFKSAVKHRINRTRPHHVDRGGTYLFERGDSSAGALSSFPSGHTAGAVAVARAVARDYPGQAGAAYAVAAGIAAIQVPRGKHYVSDLAAGAVVGLAAEYCVEQAARLITRGWKSSAAASTRGAWPR